MRISEFEALVHDIVLPAFPASEVLPADELVAAFARGDLAVVADERRRGVAIGTRPSDDVMLLTWLAVGPAGRGQGVGSALVRAALAEWQERFDPLLVLGEVEDPAYHAGSAATGDPAARLRFYQRLGARRIELPFVMPRVAPDQPRVDHMLLLALGGRALQPRDERAIGPALERFLRAYVAASGEERVDGSYADDIEAMFAAAPSARLG
ncbi:Acetyltransferase (GNAT) family protein [Bowdeniella nasicola]|uniref:Acetyltransferase (GNAT) family protein n=1 Tax=Bowdeniella nasicola TaxID=208480 RepID=A0A1H3XYZ3_9ACTO|nr:GNAT family N-acetyltransferase [Bowdeniella nasicola]SEA04533.1 Acetyltransferase (GNAT) family protein [Bowdeniella nasicola]